MRKSVMIVLALLVVLFPPYWISGIFDDDIGWCFLFGDYFYLEDLSWSILIVEVVLLLVVNAIWKRSAGRAAPVPLAASPAQASPPADVAGELGKLNALRQSGALTQEEFAEQKARLMAGAGATAKPARAAPAPSTAGDEYPTRKIANAVAVLRDAGLEEKLIAAPGNRMLWRAGKPMPPGPYLADEPAYLGIVGVAMGLAFAVLMWIAFELFMDTEVSVGMFLFMAIGFGGGMSAFIVFNSNRLKGKHDLPEWRDIPG